MYAPVTSYTRCLQKTEEVGFPETGVNNHVVAGNETQVLWKSVLLPRAISSPLGLLFCLFV